MPDGQAVTVIAPSHISGPGDSGMFPFDAFDARCLAQGDSWFSIGAFPPAFTTSIPVEMRFAKHVVVVNCARPGAELQHMNDTTSNPAFVQLLSGRLAMKWDAIFLSGGGNDLIDAAKTGPAAPIDKRLLLKADERPAGPLQGDEYISNPGWATFVGHLTQVFNDLVDRRDAGINRTTPLALHTYAHVMPRPAPAGPKFGPWLEPAMLAFAVPPSDWLAASAALVDRLAALLGQLIADREAAHPNSAIHLVDSRTAPLVAADPDSTGSSGDFVNEIHPSRDGYVKIAAVWRATLDPVL